MIIRYINPALIQLEEVTDTELSQLKSILSYKDNSNVLAYLRFKNNKYLSMSMDKEEYLEKLNDLKKQQVVTLVTESKGNIYTYSGLVDKILTFFPQVKVIKDIKYPTATPFKWVKEPPPLRYYQREAYDLFLSKRHGAISLPTGAGKSLVILNLTKTLGLKTVIISPSESISSQLYSDLVEYLGENKVGMFGGGKKNYNKDVVVAIDKSLMNIEKGDPAWELISSAKVVIVDESHMVATSVQKKIMLGILKDAPYRFFLSATQFRNDGADLLLEGITNKVVYETDFRKLVSEGFLAKPVFYVLEDNKEYPPTPSDPLKALAAHFYKNKTVHRKIAEMANKLLDDGMQVLIMIDRIEQFMMLERYLKHEPKFVYGSLTAEQKKKVPEKYQDKNCKKYVKEFNDKKIKLIVGTKAIGMGTDIRPVDAIFNLQGGKSDAKFLQLIGRGTRVVPGKTRFFFFDVHQSNHSMLNNWALSRRKIFKELSDSLIFKDIDAIM